MEWQPIETAPKDGTWVAVKEDGWEPCAAFYNTSKAKWQTVANYLGDEYDEWNLTHWSVLPT